MSVFHPAIVIVLLLAVPPTLRAEEPAAKPGDTITWRTDLP